MSSTTALAVSGLGTGVASQINSTSMITQLVAIEQQPLTNLQAQEAAVQTQLSTMGSIASALTALQTAAQNLSTTGVVGVSASYGSSDDFDLTPGTTAVAGNFNIQVNALAQAATWRSGGFGVERRAPGGYLRPRRRGHQLPRHSLAGRYPRRPRRRHPGERGPGHGQRAQRRHEELPLHHFNPVRLRPHEPGRRRLRHERRVHPYRDRRSRPRIRRRATSRASPPTPPSR